MVEVFAMRESLLGNTFDKLVNEFVCSTVIFRGGVSMFDTDEIGWKG